MTRNAGAVVEIAKTYYTASPENTCDNHAAHVPTDKFSVDINFDEASREWKRNKTSIGNGSYKYRGCMYQNKNGHICGRKTVEGTDYCASHLARINMDNYVVNGIKNIIDSIHK
jgi:hypothetical protein